MSMLHIESTGGIRILTLQRPERSNSLHPDLISALVQALSGTARDPEIRVIIITGAGRSFCAGLDLNHLLELDSDAGVEYMRSAFSLFRQVYVQRQPVIAAVNGPAIAGGFDLAAFCDIRLCSSEARFAQTEILLGLTQIMYPVYKVIGLSHAKELALTGKTISAQEAHRIGLVSAIHPPAELLSHALALAEDLASKPAEALFETKRLSLDLIELDTDSAITRMFDVISGRLRSDEHKRAVESYVAGLRHRRSGNDR